jgi:hypothetical protein
MVAAVALLGVMLMFGLAVLALTDTQQHQAGVERTRESAFNLGQAALTAQLFRLGRAWPAESTEALPSSCGPSASSTSCPDAASLASSFNLSASTGDYAAASCPAGTPTTPWTTSAHDNGGTAATYYSASVVNAQPTWDANRDGRMWVRSTGVAQCEIQSIVTLAGTTTSLIPLKRNVIAANWFSTTNSGNKGFVDTLGNTAQPVSIQPDASTPPADLVVRCAGMTASQCLDYQPNKNQVRPDTGKIDPSAPAQSLTPAQLDSLKDAAIASQGYSKTPTCPSSVTGQIVYVEGSCNLQVSGNSPSAPGVLIVLKGTVSLSGNGTYYGLIYAANQQGSTGSVVTLDGTTSVQGAIVVDGAGGVSLGNSGGQVIYDPRVFDLLRGVTGSATVPSTWRLLPSNQ